MAAVIQFTPVYGVANADDQVQDETNVSGPVCSLLEIDDFRILLDCGWDEQLSEYVVEALEEVVANGVDAVLVSHADLAHIGALPLLVGRLGLTAPIYATVPVHKFGQMTLDDLLCYKLNSSMHFDTFSSADIGAAFDQLHTLKYSQPKKFGGKAAGLTIVPLCAGRMVGSAIWKISKETEDVVYAVDFNRAKERHLNPTVLETLSKPTTLITDAFTALTELAPRKKRDAELFEIVMATLKRGGDVLIPIDTAGRVLELLVMLHQYWTYHKLQSQYGLVLLQNVQHTLSFARLHLEWMSASMQKRFEETRENPFALPHVRVAHTLEQYDAVRSPKVVLASMPLLGDGFARDLFLEMAENSLHTILLTERAPPGTLAAQLLAPTPPESISVRVTRLVQLRGDELEQYWADKRAAEFREAAAAAAAEAAAADAAAHGDGGADGDADGVASGIDAAVGGGGATMGSGGDGSIGTAARSTRTAKYVQAPQGSAYDIYVPETPAQVVPALAASGRAIYPMFPFLEQPHVWDEYGEVLQPGEWALNSADTAEAAAAAAAHAEAAANDAGSQDVEDPFETRPPCKEVERTVTVELRAGVRQVIMDGRSDSRSVLNVLENVKPRSVILIRGSKAACAFLEASCRSRGITDNVHTPCAGDVVTFRSNASVLKLRVADDLLSSLSFARVGEYEIARVQAEMQLASTTAMPVLVLPSSQRTDQPDADAAVLAAPHDAEPAGEDASEPSLHSQVAAQLPPTAAVVEPPRDNAPSVFVGDVQLSTFSKLYKTLARAGLQVDLYAGKLVINDRIRVFKSSDDHMCIDGPICEDYFTVRDVLYQQYQVL